MWLGLVLVGTAFEMWALRGKRQEATLSALTRKVFFTHTPTGRAVFLTGWAALTAWFLPHILKECSCPPKK